MTRRLDSISLLRIWSGTWPAVVATACGLLAWYGLLESGLVSREGLPAPHAVLTRTVSLAGEMATWVAVGQTVKSALLGLAIATALGVALGTVIGQSRFANGSSQGLVQFLRPIPPIALLPLTLLLFGSGETMKLVLIVWGTLWPILQQTSDGVRAIDGLSLQVARAYRIRPAARFLHIIIPGMLPYLLTGLRISAAVSLLVAVMAELVGGAAGIGLLTAQAQLAGNTVNVYAFVLMAGFLGVVLNFALSRTEGRLLFWHGVHREGSKA